MIADWFPLKQFDIVQKTRVRILIILLLITMGMCIALSPIATLVGSEFPYLFTVIGVSLLLLLFKQSKSIVLVGNLTCLAIFLIMLNMSNNTGGLYSIDLHGMFLIPIFALTFKGKRSALTWIIPILIWNFYSFYLEQDGTITQNIRSQTAEFESAYYLSFNLLSLTLPTLFLLVFEKENNRLIKNLKESNLNLETSNLQLEEQTARLNLTQTELERINQKLIKYAHIISHDLKQPVRTIMAFSEL